MGGAGSWKFGSAGGIACICVSVVLGIGSGGKAGAVSVGWRLTVDGVSSWAGGSGAFIGGST
jgi:hypothetical protein